MSSDESTPTDPPSAGLPIDRRTVLVGIGGAAVGAALTAALRPGQFETPKPAPAPAPPAPATRRDPAAAPANHSPLAEFDDAVLGDGTAVLAELALRRLATT